MSSANVTLNTIPSGTRKPGRYFEYNTTQAVRTLPDNAQSVLIIGQRLASGTVLAGVPTMVFSADDAATYFGAGSLAHRAVIAAITAYQYITLSVVAVDDNAAGQASKATVTFAGPATADGAYALYVGLDRVDIAVESADTAATIATAFANAIAQSPNLPVTAAAVDAVLTLTMKNKGEFGNAIGLSQLGQAAGVSAAIVAFSGGLNDPDISTALANVYGAAYNIYVSSWKSQALLTKLRTHLVSIAGAMEQRPALCSVGLNDTLAASTTLVTSENTERLSFAWYPTSVALPCEIAAGYAAMIASETDPAMPLNTLAITGLDVVGVEARTMRTEQEVALKNGLTPLEVGPGDTVQIVRAITGYTTNATGTADPAYLDLTTVRSLDYTRKAVVTALALGLPRAKGSAKSIAKGKTIVLDTLMKLETAEILRNIADYKDQIVFEEDDQNVGQFNLGIPAPVVPGMHVLAGVIYLYL